MIKEFEKILVLSREENIEEEIQILIKRYVKFTKKDIPGLLVVCSNILKEDVKVKE